SKEPSGTACWVAVPMGRSIRTVLGSNLKFMRTPPLAARSILGNHIPVRNETCRPGLKTCPQEGLRFCHEAIRRALGRGGGRGLVHFPSLLLESPQAGILLPYRRQADPAQPEVLHQLQLDA